MKTGKFGNYVTDGEVNATLRTGDAIELLTLDRACELLAEKRNADPSSRPRKAPAKKAAKKTTAKKSASKTSAGATKRAATAKGSKANAALLAAAKLQNEF